MDALFESFLGTISRREFLRFLQNGALGMFWLPLLEKAQGAEKLVFDPDITPDLGRALNNSVEIYKKPSFGAERVAAHRRDEVIPILAATVGDPLPAHNRVWYLVDQEGYAHSAGLQPVARRLNPPLESLPETGRLVEVTVPFTDALWNPNAPREVAYRLYFSTVLWATRILQDQAGAAWYRVPDDIWDYKYYVRAEHVRPLEPQDLSPLAPEILPFGKRLEVRLADQIVIAYQGDRAVFMARTSSGARFSTGDFSTQPGTFVTSRKRPSRHMAAGSLATSAAAYDLPGVPWVCYITDTGVAFHGTYWHNDYGRPRSHGCLNLSPGASRWVYRWTLPRVPYGEPLVSADSGTRVDIIE